MVYHHKGSVSVYLYLDGDDVDKFIRTFRDVVVNMPGSSHEDCFYWEKIQRKIIYENREYHLAMMNILDDLARNGPVGSDMLRRPKGDLASLLGNKNLPISRAVLSYTNSKKSSC